MDPMQIGFSVTGGAFGGVIAAVLVRGIFPMRHKMILDYLIMFGGAGVVADTYFNGTENLPTSTARFVGQTVGTAYMVGGTPLTMRLGVGMLGIGRA